ncbi:MAG: amidohydrolase family protein [Acidobacteria bacterium]|nr:amidohydrolase family protein [Acidobacteriota bacterium]
MQRRDFLAAAAASQVVPAAAPIPIIDTHIHLFDPRRPQGIPWPPKDNLIMYKPALPDRYRALTKSLGIVGAIEVECSPWLEDNQWVLDVAAKDTIVVGMIGNLEPGKPDYPKQLERFAKNPLFRGIRFGNLWDRSIHAELNKPEFIAGLKRLALGGYTLDSANPTVELLEDLIKVGDKVPDLKIVVDHLPKIAIPADAAGRARYDAAIRTLASRPKVYVKVSAVLSKIGDRIPYDLAPYKSKIDALYDAFGPDRLLYGSDWPNSDPLGNYAQVLHVVREYFEAKGPAVAEKYFWKNSVAAYGWVHREKGQPGK